MNANALSGRHKDTEHNIKPIRDTPRGSDSVDNAPDSHDWTKASSNLRGAHFNITLHNISNCFVPTKFYLLTKESNRL